MAIYTCFIQHVINSIKDGGRGAIVIPTGFVQAKSGVERKVLEKIVDDKVVYGCVSMPTNVFANTPTNVSVLFFDKSKKTDKVILIDASSLGEDYQEDNIKKHRLLPNEIDLIVDTFRNKRTIDNFSVAVSYDDIKKKNYYLSAGQYFDVKIDWVDITEEQFNQSLTEYKTVLKSSFEKGHTLETSILEQLENLCFDE